MQKEILPLFPSEEKWALTSQLRRAVQSVPGNIAEGYGRYYYQEGIRFCYIARGSLEETYTYISIAHNLSYIPDILFNNFVKEMIEVRKLLNGYITYLKNSKRGQNEPGFSYQIKDEPNSYSENEISDENNK